MEFILEFLLEPIVEGILTLWSKFYHSPEYDNSRLKKILTIIIGVVFVLVVIAIILLGISYLIEGLNPSLLDIVRID